MEVWCLLFNKARDPSRHGHLTKGAERCGTITGLVTNISTIELEKALEEMCHRSLLIEAKSSHLEYFLSADPRPERHTPCRGTTDSCTSTNTLYSVPHCEAEWRPRPPDLPLGFPTVAKTAPRHVKFRGLKRLPSCGLGLGNRRWPRSLSLGPPDPWFLVGWPWRVGDGRKSLQSAKDSRSQKDPSHTLA